MRFKLLRRRLSISAPRMMQVEIINGTVNGPIRSTELLELQPNAVIVGDVRNEVLEMHQGATIEGELRPMGATEKPGLNLAASNPG